MNARTLAVAAAAACLALAACTPAPRAPEQRAISPIVEDKAPIVEACVDAQGQVQEVHIVRTSGYPELDEAALKVARASRYTPGKEGGKKLERSCVKFKVKFVLKDGEPVPEGAPGTG